MAQAEDGIPAQGSVGQARVSLSIPEHLVLVPVGSSLARGLQSNPNLKSNKQMQIIEAREEFGVAGIQMAVTSFDGSEKTTTGLTSVDFAKMPAGAAVVIIQPE